MKTPRFVLPLRALVLSGFVGGFAVVACSGDDATTADSPTGDDGGGDSATVTEPPPPTDGSGPGPADSGGDAELVLDGGDLPPEDDGGLTDLDGGFDAGPACAVLTPGPYVQSGCTNLVEQAVGGALTTTSYQLAGVTAIGSSSFCKSTFASYDHRGTLEVTATSTTTATFELLDQYKPAGQLKRPTTRRFDVSVAAATNSLTFSPEACGLTPAPPSALYSVGTANGKKTLIVELPYGNGSAIYRFVEP